MSKNKKPRKKKYAFKSARPPSGNAKKNLEKFNAQIIQSYEQGKIQAALTLSQQALTHFPNDVNLLANAGVFASMLNQLDLTVEYYQKTLKLNPDHARTHNNFGLLLQQQKHFEKAQEHYQTVLRIEPNYADAHNNLATLFKQQKQFEKATEHYQTALRIKPNYADAHNNLANLLKQQKQFEKATEHYQTALRIKPNYADAHNNLANLLEQQKQFDRATEHYKTALKINPKHAEAHNNLAGLLKQQKQFDQATEHYKTALKINPKYAEAHYNLANLLEQQKQFEKATEHYQTALRIKPNYADVHNNLANLLEQQKQFDRATEHYKTALKINPKYAEAHNNLANLLEQQKQFDQATEHYKTALKINPKYAEAHNNLAGLLKQQKQFDQATEHYKTALKINPKYAGAKWNLSLLQLTLSNFTEGWQNYKFRYHPEKPNRIVIPPNTAIPHYQGEDLNHKNLVIYPEQGFGDEIQFIRYLPLLKSQKGVANIILVCRPALKTLFSTMECVDLFVDMNKFEEANVQGAHYWIFIVSLPLCFNTTLKTIPNQLPYLSSPKQQQDKWQNSLPKGFNVGLVWKGSKIHKNDENRSLPSIKPLKPLWQLQDKISKNLNFISLQKGEGEDEAQNPPTEQPIIHLGTEIQDFADSAAVVSQLDLVISVDTAIAHLAGSLNIPCWVLLPDYGTDWRWLVDRDDSPWYPNSMRLFRQTNDGDWDEVIERVVEALVEG